MNELYLQLKNLSLAENLPEHEYLFSLADKASSLLEKEVAWYRAPAKNGNGGGLLDFTEEARSSVVARGVSAGEEAASRGAGDVSGARSGVGGAVGARDVPGIAGGAAKAAAGACGYVAGASAGESEAGVPFRAPVEKPLIIVPDLHARSYFLMHILDFTLPAGFVSGAGFVTGNGRDGSSCGQTSSGGQNSASTSQMSGAGCALTVFEALSKNLVNVVCVGDLLHSELRGKARWLRAALEFEGGNFTGEAMTEEMKEGLSLLSMVMELKCAFPESFHVLKGNHENILNEAGDGNYSFGKFANEGEMCRLFMGEQYGDDVLYVVSCFEKALPLFAAFDSCVISHAEPLRAYSREELVEGLLKPEVIKGLTWTENGASEPGSVSAMISIFANYRRFRFPCYFGGHRPVRGKYALRQNGSYIQFHNPEEENVVLISGQRDFNPDTDIVSVNR